MKLLTKLFGRYVVTDSYGTNQACFTLVQASQWIAYCSPECFVRDRLTGREVLARRYPNETDREFILLAD